MWRQIVCYLLMAMMTRGTASLRIGLQNDNEDRPCIGTECSNDTYPFQQPCKISKGWNLRGSEWGCCGNYEGCCTYASFVCFLHDALCRCCDIGGNVCGPTCKPEGNCNVGKQHETNVTGTTCLPGTDCGVTPPSHNNKDKTLCKPGEKCKGKTPVDNESNVTPFHDDINTKASWHNGTNFIESVQDKVTADSQNIPENEDIMGSIVQDIVNMASVSDSSVDTAELLKRAKCNETMCVHATAVLGHDSNNNDLQEAMAETDSKSTSQSLRKNNTIMTNGNFNANSSGDQDNDINTVDNSTEANAGDQEHATLDTLHALDRNKNTSTTIQDGSFDSEFNHSNITDDELETFGKGENDESKIVTEHVNETDVDHSSATVNGLEIFEKHGGDNATDNDVEFDTNNRTNAEIEVINANVTNDRSEDDHLDWEVFEQTISEHDDSDTWMHYDLDEEILDWTREVLNSTYVDFEAEDFDDF